MRHVIVTACFALFAAGGASGPTIAQGLPPGLAGLKMVEPERERPGDKALSCAQLGEEMSAIMQRRNVSKVAAESKGKICRGKKVLDRQSEEKVKLSQTQTPALVAASLAASPATNAIVAKVNAENMALEQRQQPQRQQATAEMYSGVGGIMGAFNDPRLMRLGLLAQEKHCAQNAPRPPPGPPAGEACEEDGQAPVMTDAPAPATAGRADPFAPKSRPAPATTAPAGNDPFARR
jgi:hypothetical protein